MKSFPRRLNLPRLDHRYTLQTAARTAITRAEPCAETRVQTERPALSIRRILTLAGLIVLGLTPWARAQLPQPSLPAVCYPLTAFARPTLFNVLWGLPVFRWPFQ